MMRKGEEVTGEKNKEDLPPPYDRVAIGTEVVSSSQAHKQNELQEFRLVPVTSDIPTVQAQPVEQSSELEVLDKEPGTVSKPTSTSDSSNKHMQKPQARRQRNDSDVCCDWLCTPSYRTNDSSTHSRSHHRNRSHHGSHDDNNTVVVCCFWGGGSSNEQNDNTNCCDCKDCCPIQCCDVSGCCGPITSTCGDVRQNITNALPNLPESGLCCFTPNCQMPSMPELDCNGNCIEPISNACSSMTRCLPSGEQVSNAFGAVSGCVRSIPWSEIGGCISECLDCLGNLDIPDMD
jgi:hypothetical protein